MSTRLLERRPPIIVDGNGGLFLLSAGYPGAHFWSVGMIRHSPNPSSVTRSNGLIEIPPPAPSHIPSENEHDAADGIILPEPRPSSCLEYPPQNVPSCIQEETADADGPTDLRGSIIRWRDKVPERWDLLSTSSDSVQESEVSTGLHSDLIYHLTEWNHWIFRTLVDTRSMLVDSQIHGRGRVPAWKSLIVILGL